MLYAVPPTAPSGGQGEPPWLTITLALIGLLGTVGVAWVGVRKATSTPPETPPARRRQLESGTPEPNEEAELEELRDTLIGVLQDLQKKSREAEQLARDLASKQAEVERLQSLLDALIARRHQG